MSIDPALIDVQAELHAIRDAGIEQAHAHEAGRRGDLRVGEAIDASAEQLLGVDIERALDAEVEPVEVVEAARSEHRREPRAHGAGESACETVRAAVGLAGAGRATR